MNKMIKRSQATNLITMFFVVDHRCSKSAFGRIGLILLDRICGLILKVFFSPHIEENTCVQDEIFPSVIQQFGYGNNCMVQNLIQNGGWLWRETKNLILFASTTKIWWIRLFEYHSSLFFFCILLLDLIFIATWAN